MWQLHTCKIGKIIGTDVSMLWLKTKCRWSKVFSSSRFYFWHSFFYQQVCKEKGLDCSTLPMPETNKHISVFQNDLLWFRTFYNPCLPKPQTPWIKSLSGVLNQVISNFAKLWLSWKKIRCYQIWVTICSPGTSTRKLGNGNEGMENSFFSFIFVPTITLKRFVSDNKIYWRGHEGVA